MSCNLHSFISIGVCFLYFGVFCACSAEKKIRALLVTVDNRELIEDLNTTNYVTLSAVINMQYAKRHSYDYLFISGSMNYYLSKSNNISHVKKQINSSLLTDDNYEDSSSLLTEIISKYSISRVDLPLLLSGEDRRDSKLRVSAFNINLKQFRAAPWSKLLAVWNLLQQPEISDRYDYIFYLDSDSVLSPVSSHRSLDDFFRDADTPGSIEYGPVPSKASILVNNDSQLSNIYGYLFSIKSIFSRKVFQQLSFSELPLLRDHTILLAAALHRYASEGMVEPKLVEIQLPP